MRTLLTGLLFIVFFQAVIQAGTRSEYPITFSCRSTNDLFEVLRHGGRNYPRYNTPGVAIQNAACGSGVLILADGYPGKTTVLSSELMEKAAGKNLRIYIEYSSSIHCLQPGKPKHSHWERGVVNSDFFGRSLKRMRILAIQDCSFIPCTCSVEHVHIVLAKVAGFNRAVYGLPKITYPILFELGDKKVLVATTKLSQFVTGRYAPREAWIAVWRAILKWLCPGESVPVLHCNYPLAPAYGPKDVLPPEVEKDAVCRGVYWYCKARLLIHEDWLDMWDKAAHWPERIAPAPEQGRPTGDGRLGILEGHNSRIMFDGSQRVRWYLRADCNCESAMAFAMRSLVDGDSASRTYSSNLMDFVYFLSNLQQGPRADPQSSSFGLLGWNTLPRGSGIYYGDDNSRAFLATMAASAILKSDRWEEGLLKGILGNFRTSGKMGFRGHNHNMRELRASGWKKQFTSVRIDYSPHYESWLWATYLWLYDKTGFKPLLERTKTAIRMTMEAYPGKWLWTNGIQQERARMLLPLSWLVRVEDTPQHRKWLRFMAGELLARQDAVTGAIQEEIGNAGHGSFGPPGSNQDYGNNEASLLQENGDPVCDLLYTTNFAFLALGEASAATGESIYKKAWDKLAAFLCRIQVRSKTHPEFDGAWFRAFDFKRWEYWASNADAGWGAWSTETGWIQGWIVAALTLHQKQTSLWELTSKSKIARRFNYYRSLMLSE